MIKGQRCHICGESYSQNKMIPISYVGYTEHDDPPWLRCKIGRRWYCPNCESLLDYARAKLNMGFTKIKWGDVCELKEEPEYRWESFEEWSDHMTKYVNGVSIRQAWNAARELREEKA
jgi:hypothetical protein